MAIITRTVRTRNLKLVHVYIGSCLEVTFFLLLLQEKHDKERLSSNYRKKTDPLWD